MDHERTCEVYILSHIELFLYVVHTHTHTGVCVYRHTHTHTHTYTHTHTHTHTFVAARSTENHDSWGLRILLNQQQVENPTTVVMS